MLLRYRWGAAWLAAVLLTACSSKAENAKTRDSVEVKSSSAKPTRDDGCRLLSRSEAAAALKSSITKGGKESAPSPIGTMLRSTCFYGSEDGGTVELTVDTYPDVETATSRFDRMMRRYRSGRAVPNVGEAAFAHDKVLVARRGNVHVMVNLDPEGENKIVSFSDTRAMDALYEIASGLAVRSLERIPASGQIAAAAQSERSACAMITKDEMSTILGESLIHAVPADSRHQTVCTYTGPRRFAEVTIEWNGGETGMAASDLAGAMMDRTTSGQSKSSSVVDGIGYDARTVASVLHVRKGRTLISVDLRMQKDYEEKSRMIAERILAKL